MTREYAIAVRNVSKRYGSAQHGVCALSDVSLEIALRDFVAIMGPSGCGKTTLLNLMAGVDTPTVGSIELGGHSLSSLSDDERSDFRLRNVGFVFQSFHLFPTFTAEENVAWPLQFLGHRWSEARKLARRALEEAQLSTETATRRPPQMSGGEQQRVAIARAIVTQPRIIFADEPTGNLDSRTGHHIMELLQQLNEKEGVCVVLVTHSQESAAYSNRSIHLRDGHLVQTTAQRVAAD